MRKVTLPLLACGLALSLAAAADSPFQAFHGKMKPGLYEYRMEMDMGALPGMPPGMGKQTHTFQHCLSSEDIQNGEMGRSNRGSGTPKNCEVKNFHMSGNTATYQLVCKGGPDMVADNRITFTGNGYRMDMKTDMNEGGQTIHMKQHMEGRYLGPCKQ